MGLTKQDGFDRTRILAAASQARVKKRTRQAIALYRWALAAEPRNAELHAKLAPLLAEVGEVFDAWLSFRATAQAALREGKTERALGVYREAAHYLPGDYRVWECMARLQKKRRRDGEAIELLLEGSRQLRKRRRQPEAIYLLRRGREVAPWDFRTVFALARLLARHKQRDEARLLLMGLAARSQRHDLRRIRGAECRLAPGFGSLWRWIRAATGADSRPAGSRPWPYLRSGSA